MDKAIETIIKNKAKRVCIQLADGLKPEAQHIQDQISKATEAEVFIWAGSCYGSCDLPLQLKDKMDLLIEFGHSEWR